MNQSIIDNQHFIYYLFHMTAAVLMLLSKFTGLTYKFWNVLIWFGILPAVWLGLISKKTTLWLNTLSILLLGYLFAVHTWDKWFDEAAKLLTTMRTYMHSDYKSMSVYICVFFPLAISIPLIWFCLSRTQSKLCFLVLGIISLILLIFFPISNALIKNYYPIYHN